METKDFFEQLRNQNLDFYSDPRGKGAIANLPQTFPYPWIYITELIQNALDENARRLSFTIPNDKELLFEHDGNPFSRDNVYSLCTRGLSTKSAKTIGFMGVGFKSVFRSFEKVEISSGDWKFYIEVPLQEGILGASQRDWIGCVLPFYDSRIANPSKGMRCRFSLSGRLDNLQSNQEDFRSVIQKDLSLLPMLAIRGVEELIWNEKIYRLRKKEIKECGSGCMLIKIEATDQKNPNSPEAQWLVFSREYLPSKGAIRQFLEHRELKAATEKEEKELISEISRKREVQIFCSLNEADIPDLPERGRAFAVLPTQMFLPLRINVQADWLLDISRRGTMDFQNNQWHKEILAQLPVLTRSFVEWLVSDEGPTADDWANGYGIIPNFESNDPQYEWLSEKSLVEAFEFELSKAKFIPVHSKDSGKVEFALPKDCRYLPESLNGLFNKELRSWMIFGECIVSISSLGENPLESLKALGLLKEMVPAELSVLWNDNTICDWLLSWKDPEESLNSLMYLFSALEGLESDWETEKLKTIPSESCRWDKGVLKFITAEEAVRLPGNWQILNREPQIANTLKKYAGEGNKILNALVYFHTYRTLQDSGEKQTLLSARTFLDKIKEVSLEKLYITT
jgi:hypothetical protein